MSVALLGLIALQFYWIKTSIEVNRDRFNNNVHDALGEVVKKLEKHEAFQIARMKMENSINIVKDDFMMEYDSMGNPNWREEKKIQSRQIISPDENPVGSGHKYELKEELVISKSGVARKLYDNVGINEASGMGISPVALQPSGIDSTNWFNKIKQHSNFKLSRMSDMVSGVLNEWMQMDKSIKNRITQEQVDSLLRQEVKNRGIDIDFYYAVQSRENKLPEIVFANTNNAYTRKEVLESDYRTKLFPTDVFDKLNILYIYFPEKDSFVIREMWLLLASSAVFISLIIYGFAFAIYTIIKQKKISEITNDFISNMTHELKTPISTVSLACEALMDPDIRALPNQSTRYLGIIKEENERLSTQVEKVLQIARLDRGDFKLKIETINLHDAIEQAIKNIHLQIETRDGEIITNLNAKQPVIEADQVHLVNIINNLLDNANKYSFEKPTITINTKDIERGIQLTIKDKGQGIAKEMLNKIFDKFYRVPTGNLHDVKGFGLGLSYVKTMVNAHGGEISVKSELKKGSSFTIILPHKHE
ncbi:sensor histidine kinase [Chondrinema litorale]|uniref:sensor histidine kinase n=1 Tax=Chondrinema litorale TaxID=2994555 RepID=UPI00254389C9|nr:HAMP domain-containing sensor histidine kinase [Chondrinema litorale]UZR96045.1 HAMP domain-containing sensor histidine kinase [Chondrinema litorale]